MGITIEKNVPMPKNGVGRPAKYPFDDLAVGDSFFVPVPAVRFSGQLYSAGKRYGKTFASRSVVEKGVEGTRVWRTS